MQSTEIWLNISLIVLNKTLKQTFSKFIAKYKLFLFVHDLKQQDNYDIKLNQKVFWTLFLKHS